MNQTQTLQKSCANCAHYAQHYSKQKTRIRTVNCGSCLLNKPQKKYPYECCEFWETEEEKIAQRKMGVEQTLELIAQRLYELTLILKPDPAE
ncbi:MAG: hypothetical protein FWH03_02495 [Firmicutes bacterium]|nr:hypothetical protein [Bacillota bacterium]